MRHFLPDVVATGREGARCSGGDGWESNPPRTPQQRPADGFEDRGASVHNRPLASALVQPSTSAIPDRPPSSAVIRRLGCLLGCQRPPRTWGLFNPKVQGSTPCASTIMW